MPLLPHHTRQQTLEMETSLQVALAMQDWDTCSAVYGHTCILALPACLLCNLALVLCGTRIAALGVLMSTMGLQLLSTLSPSTESHVYFTNWPGAN